MQKQGEYFFKQTMNYRIRIIERDGKCVSFQTANPPRIKYHHFTFVSWDIRCFKYRCSSVPLNELHICISGQFQQGICFTGKRDCLEAWVDLIALSKCLAQQCCFICVHSDARPAARARESETAVA